MPSGTEYWFTKGYCPHQAAGSGPHEQEEELPCDSDQSGNKEEQNSRRSQMGLLVRLCLCPILQGSKASAVQTDELRTMTKKARGIVEKVSGEIECATAKWMIYIRKCHRLQQKSMPEALHWQSCTSVIYK